MILLHTLCEETAGEEAKRKGLKHVGWGRYKDSTGNVVAQSVDGKLVFLNDLPHQKIPHVQTKSHPSFEELRKIASQHEDVIMTSKPITKLKPIGKQPWNADKPKGLWYGKSTAWIDWVETEMPNWIGKNLYSLEIDKSNVLVIKTAQQMKNFYKKYKNKDAWISFGGNDDYINWERVAQEYDGIEIATYFWKYRHLFPWYYSWDVASGCIWNPKAIKSIKHVSV